MNDDEDEKSEQARWQRLYEVSAQDVLATFNWFVLKGFPEGPSTVLTVATVLDKWLPNLEPERE